MKPAPFAYVAPRSLDEVVGLLAAEGDRCKLLAGGQSLVPAMNMRLARPEVLVDLNRLDATGGVRIGAERVAIGPLVRHVSLERGAVPGPLGRLLARTAALVGHLPIRERGTFCGSLAHADPASEWCTLVTALDGDMVARSSRGERTIASRSFFDTVFTTALEPDEILVEAQLPLLGPTWRSAVVELSRRAGDFAVVVVVALLDVREGRVEAARIAVGGASGRPRRLGGAEELLAGATPSTDLLREVAEEARRSVEPHGDLHGSGPYRKHLVGVLVRRALEEALA